MKKALVVGASGDIGEAISLRLAQEGYSLILHYCQNKAKMHHLLEKLADFPIDVKVVQADLSIPEEYQKITAVVQQIDAMVFASGKSHYSLLTDVSATELNEQLQLSFASLFQMIQALLPKMIAQKSGNIVLVTSIWGEVGASCEVLYSSLKGAQNALVKALSKEVALSGIRVNAVSPGAVDTKMLDGFDEAEKADIAEQIPIGRLGRTVEIADAVAYLLSERSSYVTGQVLRVNGGWLV